MHVKSNSSMNRCHLSTRPVNMDNDSRRSYDSPTSFIDAVRCQKNVEEIRQLLILPQTLRDIQEGLCISADNGSTYILKMLIEFCNLHLVENSIDWYEVTAAALNASQKNSLHVLIQNRCLFFDDGYQYKMGYFTKNPKVLQWAHKMMGGLRFYQDPHMWQEHCEALTTIDYHSFPDELEDQIKILCWLVDINCCTDMDLPLNILAEHGDYDLFLAIFRIGTHIFPINHTTYSIAKKNKNVNIANHIQQVFSSRQATKMPVPLYR